MSFAILTDTSCNLPEHLVEAYRLEMFPLHYIMDGEEHTSYTDGRLADFSAFYDRLRGGTDVKTSLADANDARSAAEAIVNRGDDLLYLGFSSGLSGTYEVVANVLDQVAREHPERKVYAVDTLAASAGQGLLIAYVARMRDRGASIEECRDWALAHRLNICHWFTVDDLMFLKRGGRVSAISAVFGTALSIKPIMHVDDEGKLRVVSKVRSRRKAIMALADKFAESEPLPDGLDRIVYISHGDCYDDAKLLADTIVQRAAAEGNELEYPTITFVDPVIGAHSGPGTLALFYYDDHAHR